MEEKRCYGCMNLKSNGSVCEHCGYDENMQNEMHQLPAGTVLKEQYMIGRVLGQGGFGITYLGWDMYLDIPVAIKEYFPSGTVMRETSISLDVVSYSGDVGVRFRNNKERFLREAKMLARFSQVPEIVQIKNFFLANNTAYIVMEYVDGITLKQYVKEQGGKLSVSQTFSLMEPVIEALCKVHKSGLVHRDISPDNIMMLPEGRVKLLDFGAVRDVGDADVGQPLTKSTEAILKQGYAPIEQYQNRGSLGPWTDVYALCATIYFCLTGEVPPDAPERLLGDEEIDFKGLVPELTDRQADVLGKGMELRAQERIASMDELHQKLYLNEEVGEDLRKSVEEADAKEEQRSDAKLTKAQKIAAVLIIAIVSLWGIAINMGGEDLESQGESVSSVEVIAEGECGEELKWHLHEDGTFVLDGSGRMDDYNGLWMEENDESFDPNRSFAPWVDYMDQIRYLVIGDEVIRIGDNAFVHAENLVEIEWGHDLLEIGFMAFGSTGVVHLGFSDGIESISHFAFNHCHSLTGVDLPYRLAVLEPGTFQNCPELENVTIRPYTIVEAWEDDKGELYTPFSLGDVDYDEYVLNEKLTIHTYKEAQAREFAEEFGIYHEFIADGKCGDNINWSFRDGTLYLGGYGSTWNYLTDESRMNEFVEELGITQIFVEYPDWFYSFREDIENVVIGPGVAILNDYIFRDLNNLKNVEIGPSVGAMDFAFSGCTSLEEIVIPANVESMGSLSFEDCTNLRKVTFEGDDTCICDGTFRNAVNLEEVHCSKGMTVGGVYGNPFDDPYTDDDRWSEKVVLYVYEGSPMHEFAQKYGFAFKIVE